jgi:hypothetical protein
MYILTSNYFPTDYWPDLYFPVLPEGADIQYTEVMEFAVCIAASAEFDVIMPNAGFAEGEGLALMEVSGAGTSAVNGVYEFLDIQFGKPRYVKEDNSQIIWFDIGSYKLWSLAASAGSAYQSTDDVPTPDLVTTWYSTSGALPLPTVTKIATLTPTLTQIVDMRLPMPMIIDFELYEELSK